MDYKYPHWYQCDGGMEPCEECVEEPMPFKMYDFHRESLKDRILCLLGDEVIFSVDARICRRDSKIMKISQGQVLQWLMSVFIVMAIRFID
jgi:hypothetical protein